MFITLKDVNSWYNKKSPKAVHALKNVSLSIEKTSFTFLVGHTGSGKSTLLLHLNGLMLADSGQVELFGQALNQKMAKRVSDIKKIREKIGLVFQFPEHQLFEETVLKDVMFGPLNYGKSKEEAKELAMRALKLVGVDEINCDTSPFLLSGGQMRRIAIAGVLAMDPEVLILDEPTAGLDPQGRIEILTLLKSLQKKGKTIIVASHDMDIVAEYADHVIVLNKGSVIASGIPKEVFSKGNLLAEAGIELPTAMSIFKKVRPTSTEIPLTLSEFVEIFERYKHEQS